MAISSSGIEPVAPAKQERDGKSQDVQVSKVPSVHGGDVEVQAPEEPEKKYYSKLSVWLMILFSGLAIGSDG